MDMKKKNQFVRPAVLQEVHLLPEAAILAASVVDNTTITATGQEVTTYDFSNSSFNHSWGEE